MNYYIFDGIHKNKDIICEANDIFGVDQYDVSIGVKVEKWNDKIMFHYNFEEGSNFADFITNDLGWFIVSSKFMKIIIGLGVSNIEFLPINIKEINDSKIYKGYYVANIIGLVDALDLNNSKYFEHKIEGFPKMISVTHYALKRSHLLGHHIFRLKDNEEIMFVSEEFKKTIIKNGITGCWFKKVLVT